MGSLGLACLRCTGGFAPMPCFVACPQQRVVAAAPRLECRILWGGPVPRACPSKPSTLNPKLGVSQDLSPEYAGALLGLSNTAGALPGILGVTSVGFLLDLTQSWGASLFYPTAACQARKTPCSCSCGSVTLWGVTHYNLGCPEVRGSLAHAPDDASTSGSPALAAAGSITHPPIHLFVQVFGLVVYTAFASSKRQDWASLGDAKKQ